MCTCETLNRLPVKGGRVPFGWFHHVKRRLGPSVNQNPPTTRMAGFLLWGTHAILLICRTRRICDRIQRPRAYSGRCWSRRCVRQILSYGRGGRQNGRRRSTPDNLVGLADLRSLEQETMHRSLLRTASANHSVEGRPIPAPSVSLLNSAEAGASWRLRMLGRPPSTCGILPAAP